MRYQTWIMGWSLRLAIAPLAARTLEETVAALSGGDVSLRPSDEVVDGALQAAVTDLGFATSFANHVLFFHPGRITDLFMAEEESDRCPQLSPLFLFELGSANNYYAFARYEGGKIIRRRAGACEDLDAIDFVWNDGPPLAAEEPLVRRAASGAVPSPDRETADRAWAAWKDPFCSFGTYQGFPVRHHHIGEDVIFGLIER